MMESESDCADHCVIAVYSTHTDDDHQQGYTAGPFPGSRKPLPHRVSPFHLLCSTQKLPDGQLDLMSHINMCRDEIKLSYRNKFLFGENEAKLTYLVQTK